MTLARWLRASALVLAAPAAVAAQVLLNEIEVNPPTAVDQPYEYIELRGPDAASLAGYQVLVVDGDGGGEGFVDQVVDLSTACDDDVCTLGQNGIAVVKAPSTGHATPIATTLVADLQLGTNGSGIENGTVSILLVTGPVLFLEGTDYDTNDDGVLELPPGIVLVDAVGWTDGDSSDLVYGGVSLLGGGAPPDAATRFAGDDTPLAAAAWYHGDLSGNQNSMAYDLDQVSANFPVGGRLTPGARNEPPASVTTTTFAAATTTTTLPPPIPVALRAAVVKPSRLFRFVARGSFPIPDATVDNPRNEGATLSFAGTTGGATYALASGGWRGLGPGKDGSKGFRFAGHPCRTVVVKRTMLKGVCRGDTGTIGLPEPGPLGITLRIGDGPSYCAACGGVPKGNANAVFKRKTCAAPASCP